MYSVHFSSCLGVLLIDAQNIMEKCLFLTSAFCGWRGFTKQTKLGGLIHQLGHAAKNVPLLPPIYRFILSNAHRFQPYGKSDNFTEMTQWSLVPTYWKAFRFFLSNSRKPRSHVMPNMTYEYNMIACDRHTDRCSAEIHPSALSFLICPTGQYTGKCLSTFRNCATVKCRKTYWNQEVAGRWIRSWLLPWLPHHKDRKLIKFTTWKCQLNWYISDLQMTVFGLNTKLLICLALEWDVEVFMGLSIYVWTFSVNYWLQPITIFISHNIDYVLTELFHQFTGKLVTEDKWTHLRISVNASIWITAYWNGCHQRDWHCNL